MNAEESATTGSGYTKNLLLIGIFFFIFGFISWINGTLIPYLKIACELQEWQAYLVTFAFYISYTVMAMPASRLLQRTGMILGMSAGLYIMAAGCALFIPAAFTRSYGLFLCGLFLTGGGLTLLQTAVNPYVTLLGPANSAARRISIMGICNKVAGILAPLIMGSIILKNSGSLTSELAQMTAAQKKLRLDELAHDVILPYCVLTAILVLVAVLLRFARLPDIKPAAPAGGDRAPATGGARFLPGFTAIFFAVGAEVLAGDTIGNYGLYHGIDLDVAKNFTSYALFCMMVGYVAGIWAIPRYISQQKAFHISAWLGLALTAAVVLLPATASICSVALLGLANAMLWPAIWPQALKGLEGKALARGSAVLIMGIAGGALMPLLYGWLATGINNQYAYCILIPAYLFLLFYSHTGIKQAK